MKKDIDIKTKQFNQICQDSGDVPSGLFNQMFSLILFDLHLGRGSQHLGRDGPPGRARSPGIYSRKELHPVS